MTEQERDIKDYDKPFEDLLINYLMSNTDLFVRCKSILKSDYFDNKQNKDTIDFIQLYSNEYASLPTQEQLSSLLKKDIKYIPEEAAKHDAWFLKTFEEFCRHKALRIAILRSPEFLDSGRYGEALVEIKAAVEIALVKDLGLNYFDNPKERLERMRNNRAQISTGWKTVDDKLFGGFNRGEITIFAGQTGAGKSLFLQNLAVNWASVGLHVVYITLELSQELCAARLDAMHTGFETREVIRNIDDVHLKLRMIHQKSKGSIQIKQLPNGCNANEIRAFIKEYEIYTGVKVDAILVDYVDLMMPISKRISAENLFIKDKYVTEELRNLAVELKMLCVSATQLNRGSYEEIEFDPSHISGGISKVNTADNVIGLFTTAAMKESGRYQIQFMKTRSSSGVGSKIDLAFNNKSLKIVDLEKNDDSAIEASTKTIYEQLKKKSIVKSEEKSGTIPDTSKTKVDTIEGVTALRGFLKKKL